MEPHLLYRRLRWWLTGSLVGGVLIALPDDDRVFSLSGLHGPGAVDLVGALLVILSWLPLAVLLPRLFAAAGRRTRAVGGGLAVTGAAALVVTVRGDLGWWWVAAVICLLASQAAVLADALLGPGRAASAPAVT